MESSLAAPIIESLLRGQRSTLELKGRSVAEAQEDFLAHVQDEKHFGEKSNLTRGKFDGIIIGYTFYKGGFAVASFAFGNTETQMVSHGYTILYRKIDQCWLPLNQVSGWVS